MKYLIFVSWRLFPYFGLGCCDLQRGLVAPSAKFAGDFVLQNLFCPCLWCFTKLRLILDYNLEKSCPKFSRTYEEQYERKAQAQHYLVKVQTVSGICCRRFLAETGMEIVRGWGTREESYANLLHKSMCEEMPRELSLEKTEGWGLKGWNLISTPFPQKIGWMQ